MDARDGTFLVRDASSGCGKFECLILILFQGISNEKKLGNN